MTTSARRYTPWRVLAAAAIIPATVVAASGTTAAGPPTADGTTTVRFATAAPSDDPTGEAAQLRSSAARTRTVAIDADAFVGDVTSGPATVELFDDLHLSTAPTPATTGTESTATWSSTTNSGSISVTVVDGALRATGLVGGRPFSILPDSDDTHVIVEHPRDTTAEFEHREPDPDDAPTAVTPGDVTAAAAAGRTREVVERAAAPDTNDRVSEAAGIRSVSILTVYTNQARDFYGGDTAAENAIAAMINDTNTVFANSNLDVRAESAWTGSVDYNDSDASGADLDALTFATDGPLFDVLVAREILDADVIMIVRGPTPTSVCGTAWGLPPNQSAWDDDFAFGVIDTRCAPAPEYGYVHELGHLFGAEHVDGEHGSDDLFGFSGAYRAPVGTAGGRYRTVMAYEDGPGCDCPVVPYFSAPRTIAGIGPIGSSQANNARVIATTADRVTSYRPMPMWTFTPERMLDTRSGTNIRTVDSKFRAQGMRPAGSTLQLQITGRGSTPQPSDAVLLNVTAVNPQGPGHITVWPCNQRQPTASNLNYAAGQNVANSVLAKLDPNGKVCVYTHASMHLVVDASARVPVGASLKTVVPARLLETRAGTPNGTADGKYEAGGQRGASSVLRLDVAGRGGVPADATAAMLNVTAINPDSPGHITVWPCDQPQPTASSLNARPGAVVANAVFAKLDPDGQVCVYTHARSHLVVDVAGTVLAGSPLVPMQPARMLETRSGAGNTTVDGALSGTGPLPGGDVMVVGMIFDDGDGYYGRGDLDAGARMAVANVTVVNPQQAGHITAFPCNDVLPTASNINYAPGQVVANLAVIPITWDSYFEVEAVCLYSHATTHLLVDIVGWL